MPLFDSMSSGSSKTNRLSKMSSIPTTEDLKYALAESKRHNKAVEMPFENNRITFIIKVLHMGPSAPRWTFQRGEGQGAKVLWTRDSAEVMMIQNKIKTESAYEQHANVQDNAQSGYQQAYVPDYEQQPYEEEEIPAEEPQAYASTPFQPQRMGSTGSHPALAASGQQKAYSAPLPPGGFATSGQFQSMSNTGSSMPAAEQPQTDPSQQAFGGSIPQKGFASTGQHKAFQEQPQGSIPQRGFTATGQSMQAAQSSSGQFQAQSSSGGFQAQEPGVRPPASLSDSGRILMPPKLGGFSAPQPETQPQAPPAADARAEDSRPTAADNSNKVHFDMGNLFTENAPSATTSSTALAAMPEPEPEPVEEAPAPKPAPAQQVSKFSDLRTGLTPYDTLLFLLFREFKRFQVTQKGMALVVCEIVVRQNNQVYGLNDQALAVVGQRIMSVLGPLDVASHFNNNDFAILLDMHDDVAVTTFADTLFRTITASPLLPDQSPIVAIGAAAIPGTCVEPGVLVSSAQMAKETSKNMTPSFYLIKGG